MKSTALLVQTEVWAQEELAAQGRLLALLERQIAAVVAADTTELVAADEALAVELASRAQRERRRKLLLAGFAHEFGVAAETLSLTSLSARARAAGLATDRLDAARDRLRAATSKSLRAGRRLSVLARDHQGLFQEVLQVLTPTGGADADASRGSWIHVEA